jgi:hypothetical protein
MAKIVSFGVTDELYQRIITQQRNENVLTLSEFLRVLVDDSLRVLEQATSRGEKEEKDE